MKPITKNIIILVLIVFFLGFAVLAWGEMFPYGILSLAAAVLLGVFIFGYNDL